jgi:molecular chaperone HtpG
MAKKNTYKFQTEAKQLLDLMVHSVYSNKDIFLRELISNASDALDKLRFAAVTDKALEPFLEDPHIRITVDADKRTVAVSDSGIGMSRDELREFLGVIARSGTQEFLSLLDKAKSADVPPELIGQFGVGFYSTFMVANEVTVITRRAGEEEGWRWESSGDGTYSITEATRSRPGTTVICHLKEADEDAGLKDHTAEHVVREIVRKYSDFVAHPIRMETQKPEYPNDEEGNPDYSKEPTMKTEDDVLNSMKAIWIRPESEVTEEEYTEFYRHISRDWGEPMTHIISKAEGAKEFRTLLYIPKKAPFDLFVHEAAHGVHLYIRRVFIMNDCKELLPRFLRFVKGVVDSEDLPLNISREILQQDGNIRVIRNHVIKKVFGALAKILEDNREQYEEFWSEFGRVLKEGIFQEKKYEEKLLELALFDSSASEGKTTLDEYIERMKEGQEEIYYLTGKSRAAVLASPHLEAFKKKEYEVLLLSDPVDEVWVESSFTYKEKNLKSVGKGTVELGSEEERKAEEEEREEKEKTLKDLLEVIQKHLDEHVKEVRLSTRLTDSPACLVGEAGDMTPQLEQMLRASGQEIPEVKRILELNPDHAIVSKLNQFFLLSADDPRLERYSQVLLGQALLAEGHLPPDPAAFSKELTEVMLETVASE